MKLIRAFCLAAAAVTFIHINAQAKTWYASPETNADGWRPDGKGTLENPWDLQTALNGDNPEIKPGDTVLVRGGKSYWGYYLNSYDGKAVPHIPYLYRSLLLGKPGAPIIVKAYPGEHPVLDGAKNGTWDAVLLCRKYNVREPLGVLMLMGANTWIWGLEVTNTSPNREACANPKMIVNVMGGIACQEAVNCKIINCVIHNTTDQAISAYSNCINTDIEGCLVYYNGMVGIPTYGVPYNEFNRKNGPGIYCQNKDDSNSHSHKYIRNNIVFQQFYNGFQIYGSGNSHEDRFVIRDNTVFNNGLLSYSDSAKQNLSGEYNMLIGGHTDMYNNIVNHNQVGFITSRPVKTSLKIGYKEQYKAHNCQVDSNIIFGNVDCSNDFTPPVLLAQGDGLDFSRNIIYGKDVDVELDYPYFMYSDKHKEFVKGLHSDYNTYLHAGKPGAKHNVFDFKTLANKQKFDSYYTLDKKHQPGSWTDSTGHDTHSTDMSMEEWVKSKQYHPEIIVTPDVYEPGLLKVVIVNWKKLPEVNIDASDYVPAGNAYRLIDVQNFHDGVVMKGSYEQGLAVKLNQTKAEVPTGLAASPVMVQPEHTDARLGVFWLEYFPYKVSLVRDGSTVKAVCKDAKGKEVKPLFMRYEWSKGGKVISRAGAEIKNAGDGSYKLKLTDDKGFEQTVELK